MKKLCVTLTAILLVLTVSANSNSTKEVEKIASKSNYEKVFYSYVEGGHEVGYITETEKLEKFAGLNKIDESITNISIYKKGDKVFALAVTNSQSLFYLQLEPCTLYDCACPPSSNPSYDIGKAYIFNGICQCNPVCDDFGPGLAK